MFIAQAWAVDAQGNSVATRFEVNNDELIQVIEPTGSTTYPVTADPWLGQRLIDKLVIDKKSNSKGTIYRVYPSKLARTGAGVYGNMGAYYLYRKAFWSEAQAKGVKKNNSLRDQLYCHIDALPKTFNKSSWNLDSWRPNVSYAQMIKTNCNP